MVGPMPLSSKGRRQICGIFVAVAHRFTPAIVEEKRMSAVRIDAAQAKADVKSGALLVCAYDDEAKFQRNRLDGAISLKELRDREASVGKDREIIFYCA